jgi:hypothetical protein
VVVFSSVFSPRNAMSVVLMTVFVIIFFPYCVFLLITPYLRNEIIYTI